MTPMRITQAASRALAAGIIAAAPLWAQTSRTDPTDVQAWYGAQFSLDLPHKWETSLQYRARYVDNASAYRGSYITGDVGKGFGKHFTLDGSYRLALVDDGTYHRVALGGTWSESLGGMKWSLRGMVQHQQQNFSENDETSSDIDNFVRTRLQVKRNLSARVQLYASAEPYFKLGEGHGYAVDNWRNTIGSRLAFATGQEIDLFYIYRPDYAKATYNRTFHVVGAELRFSHKVSDGNGKKGQKAPKDKTERRR